MVVPLKVRVALLVPLRLNKPLVFSVMLKVAAGSLAVRVCSRLLPSLVLRLLAEVMVRVPQSSQQRLMVLWGIEGLCASLILVPKNKDGGEGITSIKSL